jgi:hypothetical protein
LVCFSRFEFELATVSLTNEFSNPPPAPPPGANVIGGWNIGIVASNLIFPIPPLLTKVLYTPVISAKETLNLPPSS